MKLIQGSYTTHMMTGETQYGMTFRNPEDREQRELLRIHLGNLYPSIPLHMNVDTMLAHLKQFQWVADAIIKAAEEQQP